MIEIRLLKPDALIPTAAKIGDAGRDLYAYLKDSITVAPGSVELISTGVAIYLKDPGLAGLILPRSGLGHKNGIIIGNGTGVIDSSYQGELLVSVWNRSGVPYTIEHQDRIAQLVIVPVIQQPLILVNNFSKLTERGEGGFGHTGN